MNGEIEAVRHTGKPSRLREDKYVRILCIFIFTMLNLFISYPMHANKSSGLKITGKCKIIKKNIQDSILLAQRSLTSTNTTWTMLTWMINYATIADMILTGLRNRKFTPYLILN